MIRRGSCHCGAVKLTVPHGPLWAGSCNCSICRRLGWLVAYYPEDSVRITGETSVYVHGDRMIGFHHCPVCGCTSHWKTLGEDIGRMGVNARLLEGFDPTKLEIRLMDNAD